MFSYFGHCIYSAIQLSSCKCVLNKLSCQLSGYVYSDSERQHYNYCDSSIGSSLIIANISLFIRKVLKHKNKRSKKNTERKYIIGEKRP